MRPMVALNSENAFSMARNVQNPRKLKLLQDGQTDGQTQRKGNERTGKYINRRTEGRMDRSLYRDAKNDASLPFCLDMPERKKNK